MRRRLWTVLAMVMACGGDDDGTSDGGVDASVSDSGGDATAPDSGEDSSLPDAGGSTGCGATSPYSAGETIAATLMHDGVERSFRVRVPTRYDADTPTPLVLGLHGGGGNGRQFENGSRLSTVAEREDFVVVYPDGMGTIPTWNAGGCCGSAVRDDVDDVGFVAAILDRLEGELCLDRDRVFATGMSNGGMMSHRLGCELSERLAAVAPVAGTLMFDACTPTRPVHVMHVHGSDDGHVPWEGGLGCGPAGVPFTSVPDTIEGWRVRNACAATTTAGFSEGNGSCVDYDACANADVTLCTVEGGGHSWPGGAPPAGLVECPEDGTHSTTFSASEAVWRFFATHGR